MSHIASLEIEPKKVVRKSRRISTLGETFVKVGDRVESDTILARGYVTNPDIRDVRIFIQLDVDPSNVSRCMIKKVGDEVKEGEVIAVSHSFFGLSKKVCKSPIEGKIEFFSNVSGSALIRGKPIPIEVSAHIPGKVIEVIPNEGAVIESTAAFIQGMFGIGGEEVGELVMAAKIPEGAISPDKIQAEDKGKIIVGGSLVTLESLRRGADVGVKGIICGSIEQMDLVEFLRYEIGVGITGHENVGFTLILTEGFGRTPMNKGTFELLSSFAGRPACIDGSTQIRFRIVRPEIIIPL